MNRFQFFVFIEPVAPLPELGKACIRQNSQPGPRPLVLPGSSLYLSRSAMQP